PLSAERAIKPVQLHGQPFIASAAGCGDDIAHILSQAGARPLELFRLPQVLSVLGLVQQGLGVSVSVRMALPDSWPGVVYRPLRPAVPRRVALAMLDRDALSPAAKAFLKIVDSEAGNQAPHCGGSTPR
ncbi:MAG: LysR family transcriptional regulator, partial [Lysobacteraceae bacterium]